MTMNKKFNSIIGITLILIIGCKKEPSVTTNHHVFNNSTYNVEIVTYKDISKSVINLGHLESNIEYFEGRYISPIPIEPYDSIKIIFDSIKNLVFYTGDFSKPRHFGWEENWDFTGGTTNKRKNTSHYTFKYTITDADFILADSIQ